MIQGYHIHIQTLSMSHGRQNLPQLRTIVLLDLKRLTALSQLQREVRREIRRWGKTGRFLPAVQERSRSCTSQSRVGQCQHVALSRLSAAAVKFQWPRGGQGGHRGWVRAAALLPCESAPLDSPWSPDSQPGLSHCQGPTSGVLIYMVWVAAGRGLGLGIDWKSTKLLKYHEVENQPP